MNDYSLEDMTEKEIFTDELNKNLQGLQQKQMKLLKSCQKQKVRHMEINSI